MTCFWCERDATGEVIVEPPIYKPKNGVKTLHKPERKAPVCDQHAGITARGVMKPPPVGRKPGPEQTTVFDMLEGAE